MGGPSTSPSRPWRTHRDGPSRHTAGTSSHGEADPDWPRWYARYMAREQAGEAPPA
jgi:hypothetical protein